MKKERLLNLLKAEYKNHHAIAKIALHNNDEKLYDMSISDACTLSHVISLLTDKEYFEKQAKVYNV